MKFTPTTLPGVLSIHLEPREDERGYFARTYCEREFAEHGLLTRWPQCNHTLTRRKGSLRGLHYQADPKPETKLIRCVAGAVYDVIVNVQPASPGFGQWATFELSADNRQQIYVPGGYAHGFQCLTDQCELFYQMSEPFDADLARGVRWNDPRLNIPWPLPPVGISERDLGLPWLNDLL